MIKPIRFRASYEAAIRQIEEAFVKRFGPFRKRDGRSTVIRGKENILICLFDYDLDEMFAFTGCNIVTNEGDLYYAQRCAAESPATTYVGMRMGDDGTAPTKSDTDVTSFVGTGKATAAGYPKTNDGDANNTGAAADSVSWKSSWTTTENNVAMEEVAIVDNVSAPTKALMHGLFTGFTKVSSQGMDIFVNHNILGV